MFESLIRVAVAVVAVALLAVHQVGVLGEVGAAHWHNRCGGRRFGYLPRARPCFCICCCVHVVALIIGARVCTVVTIVGARICVTTECVCRLSFLCIVVVIVVLDTVATNCFPQMLATVDKRQHNKASNSKTQ